MVPCRVSRNSRIRQRPRTPIWIALTLPVKAHTNGATLRATRSRSGNARGFLSGSVEEWEDASVQEGNRIEKPVERAKEFGITQTLR